MIRLQDVTVKFGDKAVLNQLNLEVKEGELVLLVGDNGSGKSTLLKTLAGRCKLTEGKIMIQESFCYHQQQFPLFEDMNIMENIQVFQSVLGMKFDQEKKDHLIERLNLSDHKKKAINKLSGGQRQRLGILITMLRSRNVYFLDEADSAMDPKGRSLYLGLLKALKADGKTVLWISHHIKESLQIADRCYLLKDGHVKAFDPHLLDQNCFKFSNDEFVRYLEREVG